MYRRNSFKLAFVNTPSVVKYTVVSTLIISFFVLIFNALFIKFFKLPLPQYIFSLTTWGISKFFFWQFVSYLFVQPLHETKIVGGDISISLIFHIFFDAYLVWMVGSAIVRSKGILHFVVLYFGGGLFIGIVAYILILCTGSYTIFAGATHCIYILLISLVFLFPDAKMSLFLFFPIRAKWLVFGLIWTTLFLNFANGGFFNFLIISSAMIYGYFYPIFVWEMLGPFSNLHIMEKKLIYFKRMIKSGICNIIVNITKYF
jgi:hypothetical protein